MTRTTTVSGIRPDKAGDGEWIDINGHVGRLMSTLMADGRPFSIGYLFRWILSFADKYLGTRIYVYL